MTISPRTLLLAATALIGLAWSGVARADNEFLTQLTAFAKGQLHQIAADPDLVAAITAQNATTGGYDDAKIEIWRIWRDTALWVRCSSSAATRRCRSRSSRARSRARQRKSSAWRKRARSWKTRSAKGRLGGV